MSNGNDRDDIPPEGMPPESGNTPLESGKPAVAAAPGKMMFVLLGAAIFLIIVVKSLFFGSSGPAPKPERHIKESVATAKTTPEVLPTLPQPPPPDKELPPPPPPPPIAVPPPPSFKANASPTNDAERARIKSNMIISSGGHIPGSSSGEKKTRKGSDDPNQAFADSFEGTTAEHIDATQISNLNSTLAQGKIITGVLESAINSQLPSPIRAIVSHDVYAESGRSVLIPKGSRMIGTFNTSLKRGQTRVYVIWTRVIRPDGVDIAINSPGVDTLGRAGQGGDVDNKYFEAYADALLTSILDVGTAVAGQAAVGGNNTTTSNTSALGTTTTTTPAAQAIQQGVQNIGQVGTGLVGGMLNLTPVVTIDQGTMVNIFVNKDVGFPGNSLFVQ